VQLTYLEASQVPSHLKGSYSGRRFKARSCETVTIPSDAGLWSGGSRDTFRVVRLADGASIMPTNENAAPWDRSRGERTITLEPGVCVVEHSMFCGKDMGLTFHLHPADVAKLLPAPVELDTVERKVLVATRRFKSSYMGRDRYQMAREHDGDRSEAAFPSRPEWDAAKSRLISRGLLNKAGAITTAGRNAVEDPR
jgi:hypothetical protein